MHVLVWILIGRLTSRFTRVVGLVVDGRWWSCLVVDLGIRAWSLI